MDVYAFQATWRVAQGSELALAQTHFLDLCALVGLPDHALGDGVAFERAVAKVGGGTGFADAWVRGRFAMEHKGRGADLDKSYAQLQQYKDALENPPLLIVSDFDRFEVHTSCTGMAKKVHGFGRKGLAEPRTSSSCTSSSPGRSPRSSTVASS